MGDPYGAAEIGPIACSPAVSAVMLGWELGTVESICFTIVAGFSVDYVVHLAHAYVHSTSPTRAERVRDALAEMGISVLSDSQLVIERSTRLIEVV